MNYIYIKMFQYDNVINNRLMQLKKYIRLNITKKIIIK